MGGGKGGKEAERYGERLERERGARVDHIEGVEQRHGERGGYEQEQFGRAATHLRGTSLG